MSDCMHDVGISNAVLASGWVDIHESVSYREIKISFRSSGR